MPPLGREPPGDAGQVLADRQAVHEHHPGHRVAVIERDAQGDHASTVVPGECERPCPKELITATASFATARLEYPAWSAVGAGPRSPQVGAADREAALDESGRDAMPGRGSPRMAVQGPLRLCGHAGRDGAGPRPSCRGRKHVLNGIRSSFFPIGRRM